MFNLFRKKDKTIVLNAYAGHSQLVETFPVEPATLCYPEWYRKLPAPKDKYGEDKNVRFCTGFTDLYKNSFILPCWQDYEIRVLPDGNIEFDTPNAEDFPVTGHRMTTQAPGAWPGYVNIKLISPWSFKSNSDIFYKVSQPVWSQKDPCLYSIVPGLLEFKYQHGTNVNMLAPVFDDPYIINIRAGAPLLMFTPLTENDVELNVQQLDEDKRIRLHMEWYHTYKNNYHIRRAIGKKRNENTDTRK